MSLIEVRNLRKFFGSTSKKMNLSLNLSFLKSDQKHQEGLGKQTAALDDVSFDVNEGEFFVLMGLSGSGKSTLLRHINGLHRPSSGSVKVMNQEINHMSSKDLQEFRCQQISMVFQNYGLLPHKNVEQNVCLGLKAQGKSKKEQLASAHNWIEQVGLKGYEKALPSTLSGGMRQRVGLARALATNAKILLMDEPFSALDPLTKRDMQKLLLDLQKKFKKTILFVSHDLNEALTLANRMAILKAGKMIQIGSPEEIISEPKNHHVAQFIKTANLSSALSVKHAIVEIHSSANNTIENKITADAPLEDAYQYLSESEQLLSVVDQQDKQIGVVSAQSVMKALSRQQIHR